MHGGANVDRTIQVYTCRCVYWVFVPRTIPHRGIIMLTKSATYRDWCGIAREATRRTGRALCQAEEHRLFEAGLTPCLKHTVEFMEHYGINTKTTTLLNARNQLAGSTSITNPSERQRCQEIVQDINDYRALVAAATSFRIPQQEFTDTMARVRLDTLYTNALWKFVTPYLMRVRSYKPRHLQHLGDSVITSSESAKRKAQPSRSTPPDGKALMQEHIKSLAHVMHAGAQDATLYVVDQLAQSLDTLLAWLDGTVAKVPGAEQILTAFRSAETTAALPDVPESAQFRVPMDLAYVDAICKAHTDFHSIARMLKFKAEFATFRRLTAPLMRALADAFADQAVLVDIVRSLDTVDAHFASAAFARAAEDSERNVYKQAFEKAIGARTKILREFETQVDDVCEQPAERAVQRALLAREEQKRLRHVLGAHMTASTLVESRDKLKGLRDAFERERVRLRGKRRPATVEWVSTEAKSPFEQQFALYRDTEMKDAADAPTLCLSIVPRVVSVVQRVNRFCEERKWGAPACVSQCTKQMSTVPDRWTYGRLWTWVRCASYAIAWYSHADAWMGLDR